MADLYFGLPPPVSKKRSPDTKVSPNDSFETTSKVKGSETWDAFIDSLIKENSSSYDSDELSQQHQIKISASSDLEYNPRSPNIYVAHAKNELHIKKNVINTERVKFKFEIGKRLLEKMGWKQGEGLGKNNQGIKFPITIFRKKTLSNPTK